VIEWIVEQFDGRCCLFVDSDGKGNGDGKGEGDAETAENN
jgi:hypothetical protein